MKIKRPISAVLILALLLSCICVFASAESENYTGVYNGYNYYCSAYVSASKCRVSIAYADSSASLSIKGTYTYVTTTGQTLSGKINATEKTKYFQAPTPSGWAAFVSAAPIYYINNTRILSISVGA